MDIQPINVDEPILSSMNDDGLQGLIQNTQYQGASPGQLPEGVNLNFQGEPTPGLLVNQAGNAINPGLVQGQQPASVTPEPVVQYVPDPAAQQEVQRLQRVAFEAAQARIEAEEDAFKARIENLPEHEQRLAIAERERDQTKAVNGWLNQQRQAERQQQTQAQAQLEAQQQESAKRQWAFIYATQAGLPFGNEAVKSALLAAEDRDHMQRIAQELIGVVSGTRGQQAQQQLQAGVFAAGGNNGAATVGPKPVPRSGDLDTLISSRNYTTVNWG